MKPKIIISVCALFATAWLITVCVLAQRFNIPSGDAIMYSLPLSVAKHPFDLGIPFLNDFEGYGSSWGHNWPGSMWIKGLFFMIVPYSRVADVAILSIFQLITAFSACYIIFKTTANHWAAIGALLVILSDRLIILNCAGNRFEPIAIAVLVLMFSNSAIPHEPLRPRWDRLTYLLAFICPTLHPYSLMMGSLIICFDCIESIITRRSISGAPALRLLAFTGGCATLAIWFFAQPNAMQQFTTNVALQKSFYHHTNTVFEGLKNYKLYGGLILWGAGLIASFSFLIGWQLKKDLASRTTTSAWRFLAPSLFISVIVIHTAIRCENFSYLAFGSPFAVMLVFSVLGKRAAQGAIALRCFATMIIFLITTIHAVLIPFRILQFRAAGFPDIHREISRALNECPQNQKIYIPSLFWAAASENKTHELRWSSFPLASARNTRVRYERNSYSDAKAGDRLIVDNGPARQPDRFGGQPTFNLLPPDPTKWRLVENRVLTYQGSIPWGLDFSIYELR